MSRPTPVLLALVMFAIAPAPRAAEAPDVQPLHAVRCDGAYPGHLQGVTSDGRGGLYWSFTEVLVKTDSQGKVVRRVDVASHHGDLCHDRDRIYVAVNLGEFNKPAGRADSWVYVYDADMLTEVARHATPEVVHGAGGIAFDGERFMVVGGLPGGVAENYVYEYDGALVFRKRHVLPSGHTLMGIQTAEFAEKSWWFGCYGVPKILLKADAALALEGKWQFDASLGLIGLGDKRFLVAAECASPAAAMAANYCQPWSMSRTACGSARNSRRRVRCEHSPGTATIGVRGWWHPLRSTAWPAPSR